MMTNPRRDRAASRYYRNDTSFFPDLAALEHEKSVHLVNCSPVSAGSNENMKHHRIRSSSTAHHGMAHQSWLALQSSIRGAVRTELPHRKSMTLAIYDLMAMKHLSSRLTTSADS